MQRPDKFIAKIILIKQQTWKINHIKMKLIKPELIDFTPGQFVSVEVDDGIFRAYSISSDPYIKDNLDFLVETGHKGIGSDFFKSIKIGDSVSFIGPSGRFKLSAQYPRQLYFFATGSGIAPFISMFYKLKRDSYQGKISLYLGFRHIKDVFYMDEIGKFKEYFKNFEYKIFISQPETDLQAYFYKGRISGEVSEQLLKTAEFYICGNPSMVDEIKEKLYRLKINENNVKFEQFSYSGRVSP